MEKSPKPPSRIFYGWWVVAACFLIAVYTSGVVSYGFTAIFEPIAAEFNWSYTTVSLASSLRHMEVGLFSPIIGYLIDRHSLRKILFIGAVITGISVILLARTNSLWSFFTAFAIISLGMSAVSSVTMMTAVSRWFNNRLGLVMGIATCGFGFSGIMVPVVTALVDSMGWRFAMTILGAGIFVVVLPLTLLVRNRPQDYGLIPDGVQIGKTAATGETVSTSNGGIDVSTREALGTRAFWLITLALTIQHLATNAVSTHVMPYLSSVGLTRTLGSLVATALPIASITGRFGFGWLGDIVRKKPLTALGLAMMAVGLMTFGYADNLTGIMGPFLLLFLITYGAGFGGTTTMRSILPKAYFGSKNYATILGFVTGVTAIGGILGAPFAGYVYDRWGDYHYVWVILAVLSVFSAFMIMLAPPVKAREDNLSWHQAFSRLVRKTKSEVSTD